MRFPYESLWKCTHIQTPLGSGVTEPEIAALVDELRSFLHRCQDEGIEPGSRLAIYATIARRALDAYDSSAPHVPAEPTIGPPPRSASPRVSRRSRLAPRRLGELGEPSAVRKG